MAVNIRFAEVKGKAPVGEPQRRERNMEDTENMENMENMETIHILRKNP